MSQTSYEKPKMLCADTYANQVQEWIADAAEARGGRRKTVLSEIAREAGLHVRRVTAHFYGQVRSPSAAEWEALKEWRQREIRRRLQRRDAEIAALRAQLAEMSRDA